MSNTSPTISHWTREQASRISVDERTTFPAFDPQNLLIMLPGYYVWDNWLVLDEQRNIADVEGFRVMVALVAPFNGQQGTRLYFFYSSDGEHYEDGGFMTDGPLEKGGQEWSGSTVLRSDGTLQTFYTLAKSAPATPTQLDQRLASFTQEIAVSNGALSLLSPFHHAILAEPDGYFYQTANQAHQCERRYPSIQGRVGNNKPDNFCFRDPFFFKDPQTQKTYLLFEANTGLTYCPQGYLNRSYVGSSRYEPRYVPTMDAYKANGCVGIAEFTDESYQHLTYLPPLLTTNLVTDEIERVSVMVQDGSYYLFCVTRGRKMTLVNAATQYSVFMLGFRADSLFGPYTPLNESGVVIRQNHGSGGEGSRSQNVYSFMVMPDMSVMCYANYCSNGHGGLLRCRTTGPTVQLHIDGMTTRLDQLDYRLLPA